MRVPSAGEPGSRGGAVLARSIGPVLGLAFLVVGGAKLNAPARWVERFAAWGLDPDLVVWTGAVEALLGAGVFFHGTRTFAAGALAAWMAGAVAVQLRASDPDAAGLSAIVLGLAAGVSVSGIRAGWHRRLPLPAPLRDAPRRPLQGVLFLVRVVGVAFLLRWIIGGIAFWMALPVLGLLHARASSAQDPRQRIEAVLLYLLVLGLGVSGLWGFVGHFFLSEQVARSIGWATGSPFQQELAFYHLGMGTVALLCLWIRDRYWVAAALTPALFAVGAGAVHTRDFLVRGNAAPANWGADVLMGNLVIPVALLGLLAWYARLGGWASAPPVKTASAGLR